MKNNYPRPQFQRSDWVNLNGSWQLACDEADMGLKKAWYELKHLPDARSIKVPFAPQSQMSEYENKIPSVIWYTRDFEISVKSKEKAILHFGAVDYKADVFINGLHVKTHEGGNTAFSVDVTHALKENSELNSLHVRVFDDMKDIEIPRGKQYWKEESESIFYTPTSGIWQTVWLEKVPKSYIEKVKYIPDILQNTIKISYYFNEPLSATLKTHITFDNEKIVDSQKAVNGDYYEEVFFLGKNNDQDEKRFWSPENPNLYDVTFELATDDASDVVESYFGMRKVSIENGYLMLNNNPYYMRLILDQGYYPKSLMTSPSDKAIIKDIELTKQMGFNGVRKHQKIEEPRYLYHADRMGLLVWEEMPSAYKFSSRMMKNISREWQSAIDRDYNHPSIIAWVPFNESWGVPDLLSNQREIHYLESIYHLTKAKDSTRLVISNDGWEQGTTDLLTIHDYESSYNVLKSRYHSLDSILKSLPANKLLINKGFDYDKQPILVTEFGGISYKKTDESGWGYSHAKDDQDFENRLKNVFNPLYESSHIQGVCYTQLTDIEQEMNGLLTYDRIPKISIEKIRSIVINDS